MATKQPALDERAEEDAIASAIADTEQEIFDESTGAEPSENDGDKSLEEMEDPVGEETTEDEEVEASEDDDGEQDDAEAEEAEAESGERRDEREPARVPSFRLREERDRAERAEREAAELRSRLDQLTGKVDVLTQVQKPAQEQKPAERPDMFADPEGWQKSVIAEAAQEAQRKADERFLNANMAATHEEFGDEFEFAYKELVAGKDDPVIRQQAQRILASPNPGRALMQWAEPRLEAYREQRDQDLEGKLAERFGVDPDTLNRALAMVTKGSGNRPSQGSQRQQGRSRILPDLNGAGGSGGVRQRIDPRGQDGSEASIFADAFTPLR